MMSGTHSAENNFHNLNAIPNPSPEPAVGFLHHSLVHEDALLLNGGDEKCLCGRRARLARLSKTPQKK